MTRRVVIEMDELEEALGDEVGTYLEEVANELVNQLQIEAPTGATGDLQRSFNIFSVSDDGSEIIVGSKLEYALDVHEGTGPHDPGFENIKVWARRKLDDESAAGPVWRSIKEHGTEPNPYVDRAIDETMERFG